MSNYQWHNPNLDLSLKPKTQRAISELLFVMVSKWGLVLNHCKGNKSDLHKNTHFNYSNVHRRTHFETEACSNSEMGYCLQHADVPIWYCTRLKLWVHCSRLPDIVKWVSLVFLKPTSAPSNNNLFPWISPFHIFVWS